MSKSQLFIISRGRVMECAVREPVVWETSRVNAPGKLTFDVMNDDNLGFFEGDAVRFEYDGKKIFFGYVFIKKRTNNRIISVTAYDQLRYFKNKKTYNYTGKTASEVLQMIISDFRLKGGAISNSGFKIASRIEDNQELFTIMQNATAITTNSTGKLYHMYDNYGVIDYKEINEMKLDLLIDESSGETFEYTSSIDASTYNQIVVTRENKKDNKREVYIAKDTGTQNDWGILQLNETLQEGENGQVKADTLLKLYNQKTRNLHLNKIFGDTRVRAGSIVGVQLYLGDISVNNFMVVETAKHSFYNGRHDMDLKVVGGEFVA